MPTPLAFVKAALLAAALGLAACSSEQAAQIERAPNSSFSAYKTYNFMDEVARNDSAFQHSGTGIFDLKSAVTREMESRGYQKSARPDLWVNIGIVTQQRTQTRQANFQFDGAPQYIGQRHYHWDDRPVPVGQYQEGTATVDIVDAARQQQVWQGTTSILSRAPTRSAKQIEKAVADMFAKYPVPAR